MLARRFGFEGVKRMVIKSQVQLPWPDKLIRDILLDSEFEQWQNDKPVDYLPLMDYMIDSTFQEFERDIIRRRYRDGQSLQQIGDAHCVTREWIRMVLLRCIGKLHNHQRRETILHGLEWKVEKEKQRAYEAGFRKEYRDSMGVSLDTVHNTYTMEDFLAGLPGFRCDLSDLGLSEQTYTRLLRAGITSIEKLIQSSEQELYFQYRISKRVREEITARLAEKGYRLYAERKGPKQQTIMLSTRKDNWKLQLCGEIMDYEELQPFTKVIPPDYPETFTYITQRILTQNEQVALSMRYYDQWGIDAISMKLDVSRQAVMGLLESALRKLKDDRVKVCLIHGMKGEIRNRIRIESEKGYFDGFDSGIARETKSSVGADGESGRRRLVSSLETLPLADLKLSVRASNCLYRAGLSTIGDLMRYSDKELLDIPCLGFGILNEIRDKQRQHYYEFRTDMEIQQMKENAAADNQS